LKYFDSSDGKERITVRTISSSDVSFKADGYQLNVTMDMMKQKGNGYEVTKEIKFLTPNE
jgi:hypothetical protein